MSDTPKILITGAAGRLGRPVCNLLHEAGYTIRATDIIDCDSTPYTFQQANILDHVQAKDLLEGIDTLVHIGNHPGMAGKIPQVLLSENLTMNQNMFQGAAEAGVKRIIFTSTLQLIGSHIDSRTVINEPSDLSYPLSGDTIPDPSNVYGLSKELSERMLRYYAERCGLDSVALRLPLIHDNKKGMTGQSIFIASEDATYTTIREGFSGITYSDAANLILSILRADLPGFRIYAPATSHLCSDLSLPDLIKSHYPQIPEDTPDLIDTTRITEETGWELQSNYQKPQSTETAKT